jgi:hypothetical protein
MSGCADGDIVMIVRVTIDGLKIGIFFQGRIYKGQKIVV